MADKVLTAPLAILKYNGVAFGKIKNIRVSETYQRGDVKGLGTLLSSEKPVMGITCTFSASSYFIDISKLGTQANPFFGNRKGSLATFLDSLLFNESGINISIYRPTFALNTTTGFNEKVEGVDEEVATISSVFLDSWNFDISEGAISGTDLSGTYLEPILITA